MDEKDKELQELRRKINKLEGKDLSINEKIERVEKFVEWAQANLTQHEMAMVDNCAIILAIAKDQTLTSYVSGDGLVIIEMFNVLSDTSFEQLKGEMENYECTLS